MIIADKSSRQQHLTLPPLGAYGTLHCVALFSLACLTVKAAFSSCPQIPPCLSMNLSHRIWFLPAQPATQQQEAIIQQNPARPSWASANVCERMTPWTFPTYKRCYVTWRHLIFSTWEKSHPFYLQGMDSGFWLCSQMLCWDLEKAK